MRASPVLRAGGRPRADRPADVATHATPGVRHCRPWRPTTLRRPRRGGPRTARARLRPAVEAGAPVAARRALRHRARGVLGTARGPRPRRRDAPVLARRARADRGRPAAGSPVPFGRIATDPVRLGIIERDRSLPPASCSTGSIAPARASWRSLGRWPTTERDRVGLHPRLGEMTVARVGRTGSSSATSTTTPTSSRRPSGTAPTATEAACSSSTRSRSGSSSGLADRRPTRRPRRPATPLGLARGRGSRGPGRCSSRSRSVRLVGDAAPGDLRGLERRRPRRGPPQPRRCRGCRSSPIGAGCNLAAIVANGGAMPADPAALAAAGVDTAGYTNSVVTADPALRPLTDIFAMPAWLPFANVFSIGDVLIGVGVAATDRARDAAMAPGRRRHAHDAARHRLGPARDRPPDRDRLPVPGRRAAPVRASARSASSRSSSSSSSSSSRTRSRTRWSARTRRCGAASSPS